MLGDIWYRYVDTAIAADGDLYSTGEIRIDLWEFVVVRETPKGVWISQKFGYVVDEDREFVRTNAKKKYAHPTKADAMTGFIARKKAQLRILRHGVDRAQTALRKAEKLSTEILTEE